LHLLGIFDNLVNEISEMKNEIELLRGRSTFVFVNHPAIRIESSFMDILTTDKGEVHRARVVHQRRCDRAADPAAVSVGVGKPIPVRSRRLESADENARGPVRG